MKNMQTPSHRFMAVRFETTGNFERNLKVSEFSFKLAKKSSLRIVFSWIGKPSKYKENNLIKSHNLGGAKLASHSRNKINIFYLLEVVKKFSIVVTPRVTLAGSAFHSIQKVTKEEVTRMIPRREVWGVRCEVWGVRWDSYQVWTLWSSRMPCPEWSEA